MASQVQARVMVSVLYGLSKLIGEEISHPVARYAGKEIVSALLTTFLLVTDFPSTYRQTLAFGESM